LGDYGDAITFGLKKATNNGGSEGGMVYIGIGAEQNNV
jgi:hypothetical protein